MTINNGESIGESRGYYGNYRLAQRYCSSGEYNPPIRQKTKEEKEIEMIDSLISKLNYTPSFKSNSIDEAINERTRKIKELKALREEIEQNKKEQEELKKIQDDNKELDKLIRKLRQN